MEFVLRSLLYCSSKMREVPWPELCPLWLCDMWGQNEGNILLLEVTEPSQLPHYPAAHSLKMLRVQYTHLLLRITSKTGGDNVGVGPSAALS